MVLADDDLGNSVQQARARAHDAGAQGGDQNQLVPIRAPPGIPDAHHFSMSCRVAGLNSQIMPPRDDVAAEIGQGSPYGNAAFR